MFQISEIARFSPYHLVSVFICLLIWYQRQFRIRITAGEQRSKVSTAFEFLKKYLHHWDICLFMYLYIYS